MSHLEEQARPVLRKLLIARQTGDATPIVPQEGEVLVRWATKTSWTSEFAGLGDHDQDQDQDQAWLPAIMRHDLAAGED